MTLENWILIAILVTVVGLLPPLVLLLYRPKSAEGAGALHYPRATTIFLGVLGTITVTIGIVVPIGVLQRANVNEWIVWFMPVFTALFVATGLWCIGDVCFVRHEFGERSVTYRSPWSRHRELRWEEIIEVRWRPAHQWLDLHHVDGRVAHFSTMLAGMGPFCALLLRRLSDQARARSPRALGILEQIAAGKTAELTGMHRL